MARYLLLAEKPSVMRDIQATYNSHRSEFKDDIEFGAFHGHLLELISPDKYDEKYKQWRADTLPILPAVFQYEPTDKASCDRILDRIKAGHYDALVNSCDAGREGEHIFFSFYEHFGLTLPVLRFWASDTTEATILKTLKNLLPESQFEGYREAAKLRAQMDWLVGMNFTRAATIASNKKINIGRVMSPTLKMIVDRENAINNFVPQNFYELHCNFKAAAGEYDGVYLIPPDNRQTRFEKEAEAKAIAKALGKDGFVKSVIGKKEETKAPTLYSLTELQKDASKYFGYTADKTLAIAQNLYERWKVTTYPRTECRVLPTAIVPEIPKHIAPIFETPLKVYAQAITKADIDRATKGKDYVDNAKLTDHFAIIPTTEKPRLSAMTPEEQNVYLLVCKRFLSIFMPPYVVEKTTIITDVGGSLFKTLGKVEVDKGFGVLYTSKAKDTVLPPVKNGDKVNVTKTELTSGQTSPPQRYNTSTLLDAMQYAGNFVSSAESRKILKEIAGIGTTATRAEIIKKLQTVGMVEFKKNVFIPTEFGMQVIDIIGDQNFCSPQMTADWEEKLQGIEDGSYKGDFKTDMTQYITDETAHLLEEKKNLSYLDRKTIGKCPCCGKNITVGKNYYMCADYKNGCSFIIPKEYFGATISESEMTQMLKGKATKEKTFTVNGKSVKSVLDLNDGKLYPNYQQAVDKGVIIGKCPCCGGDIYESKNFYLCVNRDVKGCTFMIKKELSGASISATDVKNLLTGKAIGPKQFTWKNGKTGAASVYLDGHDLKFKF